MRRLSFAPTTIAIAVGLGVMALLGCLGWLARLPDSAPAEAAEVVPQAETAALLAALRPPGNRRPVVAIIGLNDATELTDYLLPASILRRADLADVVLVAPEPKPVQLYPVLQVQPDMTIAEFDAAHGTGADYVIVPAMSRVDDPRILDWLRRQAGGGARIIAICAGARVVAAAGLLDGRRATTHWYYRDALLERHPGIRYVVDRRMVADGPVVTTTGITASIPMMLTLIEALGGRATATAVAAEVGVDSWDGRHRSDAFRLTRQFAITVVGNRLRPAETLVIGLEPGIDEAGLALVADAWSRTWRSKVRVTTTIGSMRDQPVVGRSGLRLLAVETSDRVEPALALETWPGVGPAIALDRALATIASRYGETTRDVVATQLEYSRSPRRP